MRARPTRGETIAAYTIIGFLVFGVTGNAELQTACPGEVHTALDQRICDMDRSNGIVFAAAMGALWPLAIGAKLALWVTR